MHILNFATPWLERERQRRTRSIEHPSPCVFARRYKQLTEKDVFAEQPCSNKHLTDATEPLLQAASRGLSPTCE